MLYRRWDVGEAEPGAPLDRRVLGGRQALIQPLGDRQQHHLLRWGFFAESRSDKNDKAVFFPDKIKVE